MTLPVSTQWVLDSVGSTGRVAVESVFLILCLKTNLKGSGWLHKSGKIITNEHVVRGCDASEIVAISSSGVAIKFTDLSLDPDNDLVLLTPFTPQPGGLELDHSSNLEVGMMLHAWGYPLGYNGPAPLLSVGYLAGFSEVKTNFGISKHLVVNGAFNPGNSGGPVFVGQSDKVIGIVVSKHAPISPFHEQAIATLSQNPYGIMYPGTDANGNPIKFSEAQLVGELLQYFRSLTQVMIGEAIPVETVASFLQRKGLVT